MSVQLLYSFVLIAIVHNRSIVTGQDYQSVFADSQTFQSGPNLSPCPVKLSNRITAKPHDILSAETVMWITRHMDIVGTHIEEERLVLILLDELNGMCGNRVGYILVLPQRFTTTLHVTNATDSIHD